MTEKTLLDDAIVLHQQGRLHEAAQVYLRIIQNEPNHAGALHLLGVTRHQQADHERAIELIGRAIALSAQNAVYWNNFGLPLHSLGRFMEALVSFRHALEIHPQYAQALANLGMAQHSLGQHEAAMASFREALKLEPYHADALIKLAVLLEKLGRPQEAIRLYEEGIRHAPCLHFNVNLGALFIATGRADLAIGPLQEAIRLAPDCATAYVNLGMARAALGQDVDGEEYLRKALELQPRSPETLKRLAVLLQRLDQGEELIRVYEQALAERQSAELQAQLRGLTILTRRWDGRCPTAAAERLLFDGMYYYTCDQEGSRTSRYQKDAHGNQIKVTAYQWNDERQLTAVACGGSKVSYACNLCDRTASPAPTSLFAAQTEHDRDDTLADVGQAPDGSAELCYYTAGRYGPRPTTGSVGQVANLPESRPTADAQDGLRTVSPPHVSVVMPVFNGAALLDRAIRSVAGQTFPDWELVAVDDGSSDESYDLLRAWANRDPRIRVIRRDENRGVSAARNGAIETARGPLVTYLDQDDEYYPEYLASVARLGDQADVLVFGYDFDYEDGAAINRSPSWDPVRVRHLLFAENITTPLGVAHRRDLWDVVGGFNEAWCEEDSDFWRRMARTGASFVFLGLKSGRYHVRRDSASRRPHITHRQSEMFLENWHRQRPMYEVRNGRSEISNRKVHESPHPLPQAGGGTSPTHHAPRDGFHCTERDEYKRKIAFVSPHCIIDSTNGAATATLDGLTLLARSGFECQAFCSSRMNACEELLVEEILAQRQARYIVRNAKIGGYQARMIFSTLGQVPVTLFNTASTRAGCISAEETSAFLAACEIFLTKNRPDVVWTYGGDPVSLAVQKLVKRLDIPILFALHNFAYRDPLSFRMADFVIVPTEFCRQHYWAAMGLAGLTLPLVVDPERVGVARCPRASHHPTEERNSLPRYVTFVNPQPTKGLYVFARLAEVLARRRPEIPLLVIEGRGGPGWKVETGIDLSRLTNVTIRPNTVDPRTFYAETKLFVVPSLWNESFGLVAAEPMLNGIPVLASNRGALPETIGDAGFLFDIPAKYTPETREVPTVEEVEPWVETIIRLWDDPAEYERWSRAARERAQQWHPDRLAPVYRQFFGHLTHQPGPPLMPRRNGAL